jgi:uncharacterized RDD family membrane protein YckC
MKRALAWLLDVLIVFTLVFVFSVLTFAVGFFFFGFLMLVFGFVYRTVTLASRSATIGMRLVSIEIRNRAGERLDLPTAALHTLGYQLSMAFMLVQIASIVFMLTGPRGQGLTDMVLGTAAVNRAARG